MYAPIGPTELILLLVIVLVVFGPGKLPHLGQALGRGLAEFRQAVNPFASGDHQTDHPPLAEGPHRR